MKMKQKLLGIIIGTAIMLNLSMGVTATAETISDENQQNIVGYSVINGVPTIDTLLEETVRVLENGDIVTDTTILHEPRIASRVASGNTTITHKHTIDSNVNSTTASLTATFTFNEANDTISYSNVSYSITPASGCAYRNDKLSYSEWGGNWFTKKSKTVKLNYEHRTGLFDTYYSKELWITCDTAGTISKS